MNIFVYIIASIVVLALLFILWALVRAWLGAHLSIQELSLLLKEQERELLSQRNAIYRRTGNYGSKKKKRSNNLNDEDDEDDEDENKIPFDQSFADSLTPDERQQYVNMSKRKYKNDED